MKYLKINFLLITIICFQANLFSQENEKDKEVALVIINQAQFCSLITVDNEGIPEARMMQTLPVQNDFVIWLGTKPNTRKVAQIKSNPNVSVYFTEANSTGYVNIQGKAEMINDKISKEKHWKTEWETYYPNKDKDFVLIRIIPQKMQIVSYANGIVSEKDDWRAKEIIFQ